MMAMLDSRKGNGRTALALLPPAVAAVAMASCWATGMDPPPDTPEVFIEGGAFWQGTETGAVSGGMCHDERAVRRCVVVRSFAMDATEVTNVQYRHCVARGACEEQEFSNAGGFSDYRDNPKYDSYPVVHVTWEQARRYCAFRGKRLPTEAEWEFAAKSRGRKAGMAGGTGQPNFPWGNEVPGTNDCSHANVWNCSMRVAEHLQGSPMPVGDPAFRKDSTDQGVRDLAGNVREWVADWYDSKAYCDPDADPTQVCANPEDAACYRSCTGTREPFCVHPPSGRVFDARPDDSPGPENHRVVRGASYWDTDWTRAETSFRWHEAPAYKDSVTGFRCVRDLLDGGAPCQVDGQCASGDCTRDGTCAAWQPPVACDPDPGPSAAGP